MPTTRERIAKAQADIVEAVDREITELGIEHDEHGNRAKAYLWCLETRCPQTGWMVPIAPSWVISKNYRTCARLVPEPRPQTVRHRDRHRRVSSRTWGGFRRYTQDGDLVYELDGETYRTPIKTIRGDYRSSRRADRPTGCGVGRKLTSSLDPTTSSRNGSTASSGSPSDTLKIISGPSSSSPPRPKPTCDGSADRGASSRKNLARWQEEGLVPDLAIEPGRRPRTQFGRGDGLIGTIFFIRGIC